MSPDDLVRLPFVNPTDVGMVQSILQSHGIWFHADLGSSFGGGAIWIREEDEVAVDKLLAELRVSGPDPDGITGAD